MLFLFLLFAPLFDQLPNYHHPVSAKSQLAESYFEQGLLLFYDFDYSESLRSFEEAARLAPDCGICHWGVALANGYKDRKKEAKVAIEKALAHPGTPVEKAYVEALARRYAGPGDEVTKEEKKAYAEAMEAVVQNFPDDNDAKILYVDATFWAVGWEFYEEDGSPKSYTPKLESALKAVLKKDPGNLGAHHFTIHLLETSPNPAHALPSADFLMQANPSAEHFMHMPTHIYMLLGRYHEATLANQRSTAAYKDYEAACRKLGFEPLQDYMYQHTLHFLFATASLEGRKELALHAANELTKETPAVAAKTEHYLQPHFTMAYLAKARFGMWEAILSDTSPVLDFPCVTNCNHYVRALAYAKLGKRDEAKAELKILQASKAEGEEKVILDMSIAVVEAVLAGNEGVSEWKKAVALQDSLGFKEPMAWYFPLREGLGSALLKAGRAAEAESTFRTALLKNPSNGWALFGLLKALRAQGKPGDAVEAEYKKAWSYADIEEPLLL